MAGPFDDLASRKGLTFRQAEGLDPLPTQLQRTQVTQVLRARLWDLLYRHVTDPVRQVHLNSFGNIDLEWSYLLRQEYVERRGGMTHLFNSSLPYFVKEYAIIFQAKPYDEVFGLLQFLIQHGAPGAYVDELDAVLKFERAAFRIVDRTLVPVASEEEFRTIKSAIETTQDAGFMNVRTHLLQSSSALSEGRFADSVRESIHAVEGIARTLEETAELSKALAKLEKSVHLHRAMKHGFIQLYGYTSDENGIRHALLFDGDAKVDEADALFMIGACASFVSYLIAKKAAAGIST